jgi:catechol 2,3-dioxygenase-like lactoylglutathione lyase family enzyme
VESADAPGGKLQQMNLLRCDHIHLIASNVEETVQWYCRILDAKVTFQGEFRGSKVYYLDIAGMAFVVFGKLEEEETPVPGTVAPKSGVDHFGFAVGDMVQTLDELRARGARILEGPVTVRPGLRIAYIAGPDQIRIELCERRTP